MKPEIKFLILALALIACGGVIVFVAAPTAPAKPEVVQLNGATRFYDPEYNVVCYKLASLSCVLLRESK